MKAAKLYGVADIRVVDIATPKIDADSVLIKVKSVGLCRSDIHYFLEGGIGDIKLREPLIPGHEFAGEVFQAGENIKNFRRGDRVAVDPALPCMKCELCLKGFYNLCPTVKFCGTPPNNGALSEYYLAKEEQLFKIPEKISFDDGALLEPLGVAIHSLRLSKVKKRQSAAIIGGGTIGLLLLQLLKMNEINPILVIDIFDKRLNLAISLGADYTLNSNKKSVDNDIFSKNISNGFDVVFETAGDYNTPEQGIELSKPGGKVILIGINSKDEIKINGSLFRRKGLSILYVRRMNDTYPESISLAVQNKIKFDCLKGSYYDLDDIQEAFRKTAEYKTDSIKTIIHF